MSTKTSPADKLAILDRLKPDTHGKRHAIPKTQGAQVGLGQSFEHRGIACRMIGKRQIDRAARTNRGHKAGGNPSILSGKTQGGFAPAIEGHVERCGIQQTGHQIGFGHRKSSLRRTLDKSKMLCYTAPSCNLLQL
jgi:hypothetical protein